MAHFTPSKRSQLEILVKLGKTQTEMALLLDVAQSTISRELKRCPEKYCKWTAQYDAEWKRSDSYSKRGTWYERNPALLEHMLTQLRERWSPEQIVGELRRLRKPCVSAKTFYDYIWKHEGLYRYLRRKGNRHWPGCTSISKLTIPRRRDISERPKSVNARRRFGDWESDLIIGKDRKSAVATFVERKSRYCRAVLLKQKSCREFNRAAKQVFRSLPQELRRTMTHDNGTEIHGHQKITRSVGIIVYCATPYHSWERGLNEHTNGLIRDYYPKKTDFRCITQKELDFVIESINNRPRHCLNFRSPQMVFEKVRRKYAFHGSE